MMGLIEPKDVRFFEDLIQTLLIKSYDLIK